MELAYYVHFKHEPGQQYTNSLLGLGRIFWHHQNTQVCVTFATASAAPFTGTCLLICVPLYSISFLAVQKSWHVSSLWTAGWNSCHTSSGCLTSQITWGSFLCYNAWWCYTVFYSIQSTSQKVHYKTNIFLLLLAQHQVRPWVPQRRPFLLSPLYWNRDTTHTIVKFMTVSAN